MKRLWWSRAIRVKRTDKVLAVCVSFLVGLLLARLHLDLPGLFVILLGVLTFTGVKKPLFHFIMLALFGLSLGVWRGAGYLQALQPYQELARQKVTLRAKVSQDAVYGTSKQLSFEVKKVHFISPRNVEVPGTIKVNGFGELAIYRGDVVEITGKLYPTRGGKQATMSYAQVSRIAGEQTWADSFRRSFVAGMQTALPEPAASFGSGLLIGQRNTLPFAITQAFLMVGLTHIIAVSGYNLTILVNAAKRLLEKRSKQAMVITALGLIGFFLLVTGASASIVRASVVSGLALSAWYYGRSVRPMVLIMLAAAMTAYATPVYFWSDIGWWLSMLAFFGILVLAPAVLRRFWLKRRPPLLAAMVVETLAAEIMTIPLVMFIFGQVSLVALVANVLVVLFIPIAMLLSFIAGLAGMLIPLASGWVAWPAQLLLTYMLDTASLLARLPHVFQTNVYLSAVDMATCYGLVLWGVFLLHRRRRIWFSELATNEH
ncbi:ComEC/Rec2 family competence protein [Candidatus Saccharibacteria bacterium]|nr:MAG: ComEC/Rec2 family competence protein [Candidatus Saccharibacteria bacterium]